MLFVAGTGGMGTMQPMLNNRAAISGILFIGSRPQACRMHMQVIGTSPTTTSRDRAMRFAERANVLSQRAKDERTGPDRRPSCTSTSSPASWMVTWSRSGGEEEVEALVHDRALMPLAMRRAAH
jgi:hypothetical protein